MKKSLKSLLTNSQLAGIVVAVLILLVIVAIAFLIYRRKSKSSFDRFDGNVRFSKSNGHSNGTPHDNPIHEMDDPAATAIKKGNKLYT